MKYLFVLFSIVLINCSCHYIRGSGRIVTEKRVISGFKGIRVGGPFEVELKMGPVAEVVIESDDNVLPYIETNIRKDILWIGIRNLNSYSNTHLKVFITAPVITDLTASASANIIGKDLLISKGSISINASSASTISAEIDAPDVEAGASSGASIRLSGRTRSYMAHVSSGAHLNTFDLLSEQTKVTASSGGTAHLHASVNLEANASSGASVSYHGAANVQKSVSSGGSVERGG